MGGDMWLVLAWAGLGLVAHSTYANRYSDDETLEELQDELRAKGGFDSEESDLFKLLNSEESGEAAPEWNVKPKWKPKWEPKWKPKGIPRKPSYASSEEVIESIDEIKSMTPIKKIEEVKSITPVKSIKEVKSITPIKSIEEVKSMKEIKSILPVPDDIAKKFIRKNNLVPVDGGGASYPHEIDLSDDQLDVDDVEGPFRWLDTLQEGVITIQAALDKISAQGLTLCDKTGGREIDDWDSAEPISRESTEPLDSDELPFSPEDVTDIQEIEAMEEVKSMLPIKSIDEIKSITPIKSIKEVKGLYELTDRQARLLRKLNRGDEGGYGGYGRYRDDED